MNTTETHVHPPVEETAFFRWVRSWGVTRSRQRVFGGVIGGLAAHWDASRHALRFAAVIFAVVLAFLPGSLVIPYVIAWIILPDAHGNMLLSRHKLAPSPLTTESR